MVTPTDLRRSLVVRVSLLYLVGHLWSRSWSTKSSCVTLSSSFVIPGTPCLFSFCPSVGGPWRRLSSLLGVIPLYHSLSGVPGCKDGVWKRWDPCPLGGLEEGDPGELTVPLDTPKTRLGIDSVYVSGFPEPGGPWGPVVVIEVVVPSDPRECKDSYRRPRSDDSSPGWTEVMWRRCVVDDRTLESCRWGGDGLVSLSIAET